MSQQSTLTFYDFDLGCTGPSSTECKACRMAKDITTGECLDYCPENTFLTSKGVCEGES